MSTDDKSNPFEETRKLQLLQQAGILSLVIALEQKGSVNGTHYAAVLRAHAQEMARTEEFETGQGLIEFAEFIIQHSPAAKPDGSAPD